MKKNVQLKIFSIFMVLIILCSNFPMVANTNNNNFYLIPLDKSHL